MGDLIVSRRFNQDNAVNKDSFSSSAENAMSLLTGTEVGALAVLCALRVLSSVGYERLSASVQSGTYGVMAFRNDGGGQCDVFVLWYHLVQQTRERRGDARFARLGTARLRREFRRDSQGQRGTVTVEDAFSAASTSTI